MIKLFITIFFAFSAFNLFAYEANDSIFDADPYFILMGEADDAISAEKWDIAAARLNDALSIKPDHPSNALLLNNLASVYINLGQDSLALASYDKALDIAPSMITIINSKGRLLLKKGRDHEAFYTFENAIAIDSLSTDARFYHGIMALYAGNKVIAEQDFGVLNSIAPYSLDTAIALSSLYSLTGRDREAIPYLKRIIEHEPSPEYYAMLAGCYLELEELTDASAIIAEGLNIYPTDPELYYYRAWLRRDQYMTDDAHADARKAIELGASPTKVNDLFTK